VDHAQLHVCLGPDLADRVGQALQSVAGDDAHVGHTAVAWFGPGGQPVLSALAAGADPQAEHVAFAGQVDPDRHVHGPVGHRTAANLGFVADLVIACCLSVAWLSNVDFRLLFPYLAGV
jgi:hypothetical protein